MATMTPAMLLSLRDTLTLLALPSSVQDTIASLQLAPVQQGFVKKPKFQKPPRRSPAIGGAAVENWRAEAIIAARQRHRDVQDVDYAEVFAALNKLAKANYEKLSGQILEILTKRKEDNDFRLRVVTLVFGKGTENAIYSDLFATLLIAMRDAHEEVAEDLAHACNIDTWRALYAEDIIVLPSSTDPKFSDAVITWTKQKDRRRGFSRFMTELYVREMIDADCMKAAIQTILDDLQESVAAQKTPQTEEYVNQLSTFVFDTAKALKGKEIATPIKDVTAQIVANAKACSCLPMRAKFKIDDASKLL
jgi:hypothetical protein